ncbi:hypothetical protein ACFE04_010426 [Oxalis oulophora]
MADKKPKIVKTHMFKLAPKHGITMTNKDLSMIHGYCPLKTIRISCSDPDATDSSSDEDEVRTFPSRPRGKTYITELMFPDFQVPKSLVQNADEDRTKYPRRSVYEGVRERGWGTFAAEIRHPITRERIWLGSYNNEKVAAGVYDAKKREFERIYGFSFKKSRRSAKPNVALEKTLAPEASTVPLEVAEITAAIPNDEWEETPPTEESKVVMEAEIPNAAISEESNVEMFAEIPNNYDDQLFLPHVGSELRLDHQEIGLNDDNANASGDGQQDFPDPLDYELGESGDGDLSLYFSLEELFPEEYQNDRPNEDLAADNAPALADPEINKEDP